MTQNPPEEWDWELILFPSSGLAARAGPSLNDMFN